MSIIIEQTYKLIDELNNSELIKQLRNYKQKLMGNEEILLLIKKINKCVDANEKIILRKKLYQIVDYQKYMELYNELALIVFQINKKYAQYTNTRKCQCHEK